MFRLHLQLSLTGAASVWVRTDVLSLSRSLQNAFRAAEKQMETLFITASGGKSTLSCSSRNMLFILLPSAHYEMFMVHVFLDVLNGKGCLKIRW